MRRADLSDLPALKALWSLSFPEDSEAERDAFFEAVPLSDCLVEERDGAVASMVFDLDVTDGERRYQYIYAACTHPEKRGRGTFSALMNAALSAAKARGCAASFLHPAEASLEAFYARFGYQTFARESRLCGTAGTPVSVTALSASDYAARRERLLKPPYIRWSAPLYGLVAHRVATDGAIALCERQGETLLVKEWLGDGSPSGLAAALGCTRFEQETAHVMWLPFDKEFTPPYVGPVFD